MNEFNQKRQEEIEKFWKKKKRIKKIIIKKAMLGQM